MLELSAIPKKMNVSTIETEYWIFGTVLLLLAVLAFTRVYYGHFISDRFGAYTATRYLKQLIRKELVLYHPYSIITLLLFATGCSLVFLKALEFYYPAVFRLADFPDYVWFLMGTGVVMVWIIGRAVIFKIVQFLIGSDFGQTENRYRIIVFNQVCAYVLIPLVSIAYFIREPIDRWLIFICLALLLFNYLYRIIHSLITAFNYSANLLYLFLYLCTLEIVPLLIIAIMIMNELAI